MKFKQPFQTKIGLALGGGGARGIAHVGVLKAMSESEHQIDCISGTSAGALVAALYAFGKSWEEIQEIFSKLSLSKMGIFSIGSSGIMDGTRFAKLITDHIGDVDIADAQTPLGIVCCDLISGKNIVFTEGPAALLVQASCAFPGLFKPVSYKNMLLVDGFLTENVPVSAVHQLGANFVISVNLSTGAYTAPNKLGIRDVLNRSFDILVDRPAVAGSSRASYYIDLDMSFVDRFKVSDVEKSVNLGYEKTKIMLGRNLLYWYFKPFRIYLFNISQSLYSLYSNIIKSPNIRTPGFHRLFSKKR